MTKQYLFQTSEQQVQRPQYAKFYAPVLGKHCAGAALLSRWEFYGYGNATILSHDVKRALNL